MTGKWAAAFAVLVLVAGCVSAGYREGDYDARFESKDRGALSRYYHDKDSGKFYKYGNFCGPGVPFAEGDRGNLKRAAAIEPVDTIDLACKMHDICYMVFGADDSDCDYVAHQFAIQDFSHLPRPLGQQCHSLTAEIRTALSFKDKGEAAFTAGARVGAAATGAVTSLTAGIGYLQAPPQGFPSVPGHCVANFNSANTPNANTYMQVDPFVLGGRGAGETPSLKKARDWGSVFNVGQLAEAMLVLGLKADGHPGCVWRMACPQARLYKEGEVPELDLVHMLRTGEVRLVSRDMDRWIFGNPGDAAAAKAASAERPENVLVAPPAAPPAAPAPAPKPAVQAPPAAPRSCGYDRVGNPVAC